MQLSATKVPHALAKQGSFNGAWPDGRRVPATARCLVSPHLARRCLDSLELVKLFGTGDLEA